MKQKRVAMISVHECPLASSEGKERGGINVYTFELGKALAALGQSVDIFTRIQDDKNPRIVRVNTHLRVIHLPNGPHTPLSKKDILTNLPEFTHAFSRYVTSYDLIHAHYYLSGIVAEQFHVPLVMTFHTLGLMKQLVTRVQSTDDPMERIPEEKKLAQQANHIIASSASDATYLKTLYDIPNEHISAIPPGVDTQLFHPIDKAIARQEIKADPKHKIILAVGRIDPVKGFDLLLIALKMLNRSDVCLWIVGGDIGQKKEQWSKELHTLMTLRKLLGLTTQVTFVPPLPQERLPYYYNAADVLVMPSHYESFGMVALEAASCGTPVIATDVTGISSILKDLPGGHIISANNPITLCEKIIQVFDEQHILTTTPNNVFTWEAVAQRVTCVYNTLFAAGS